MAPITLACFKVIISSHFSESIIFPTTFSIMKGIFNLPQSINSQHLTKFGDETILKCSFTLIWFWSYKLSNNSIINKGLL